MGLHVRRLALTSLLSLIALSPALAQTVPSTLRVGEVFSTSVAGRADLTLDFTDRDYELILYALQTTEDTTKTFRFTVSPPAAAKVAFIRALKAVKPDDRDRAEMALRAEERRIAEGLRQDPYAPSKPAVTQAPVVGSTRQFVFSKFGNIKRDTVVTARLAVVSGKTLAYVDVDTTGLKRPPLTTAQIQAMLEEFDRTTYPLVTSVFGKESDVDGDGRVLFLFTPLVNRVGGVAGFYSPVSALPKDRGGNGNLSDMMFTSLDHKPTFYRSHLAHEFQHLVNFNQHVLSRPGGQSEESWLNEALSHLTEDLVGDYIAGGNRDQVETFLAHPEQFSLTGDAQLNPGIRGAAYLFVRGLVDQKGQGILTSLTQTGKAGVVNVEAVTGQPFADLYRGWAARLFLSGTKLNADPALNYAFPFLTETTTGRRILPPPREDALMKGNPTLSGALRQRSATFIRLTGSDRSAQFQVSADVEGDVQALLIPVPKTFRTQLVVPVDYFEFLKLDAPLPANQTSGAGFSISGTTTDPAIRQVTFSFRRQDRPDTLGFAANVVGGKFSRPTVFTPSQAGTYTLDVFAKRDGGKFEFVGGFASFVVNRGVTDEVILPVDFFEGLRLDQPLSANRTSGAGFSLSGATTDPAIQQVTFSFRRQDRSDTLSFIARVSGGRFSRPVVFTPSQAGAYALHIFVRRDGSQSEFIGGFEPFVVAKGLTDDVVLPADYFNGITFDAPFPATITAGVGLRLSGVVADQTATEMAVGFSSDQGKRIDFRLDVQGGRFSQDVVFAPEQAGIYEMNIFLGQKGQSLPYLDGFSPVTVKAVPGIKVAIPTGFFAGLALDAPFPTDVFIGKAVRFSGAVTNSANTQIAVRFDALDGGQNIPTSFINVSNGRFSQDLTLTQTGRYRMIVFLGVRGQSLPFAGQFDGVRVRAGQADIAVTVPRLDFGEVSAGGSKELTLTLYNRGTLALTVRDVNASSPLLTATPRTATVAAGDSVKITVAFRPTGAGDLAGTLTVLSDDPDEGSLSVSAVGRGLAQTALSPSIALSAISLSFDSVRVSNVSRKTLTVSNAGNDTLRVMGAAISGADSAHFSVSPTAFRVAPGGRQEVTVTFAPGAGGKKSATLSIAHNAARNPSTVSLTGTGVAPVPSNTARFILPTQLSVTSGEMVRIPIVADDGGATVGQANIYVSVDTTYFEPVDRDPATAGAQPYTLGTNSALSSSKIVGNTAVRSGNRWRLDLVYRDATGFTFLDGVEVLADLHLKAREVSGTVNTTVALENDPGAARQTSLYLLPSFGGTRINTTMPGVIPVRIEGKGGLPSPDFDGDREVGFGDFFLFADAFGSRATGGSAKFDLDGDGEVGFGDFFLFADAFGKKR